MTKTMKKLNQHKRPTSLLCKIKTYIAFYKMKIKAHNATAHHILKNKVDLILPKFYEGQKNKRGILVLLLQVL